jgi:hypothetical protein
MPPLVKISGSVSAHCIVFVSKVRIVHHGKGKSHYCYYFIIKQACLLHMKIKQIDKHCLHIEKQFKKLLTMYFFLYKVIYYSLQIYYPEIRKKDLHLINKV